MEKVTIDRKATENSITPQLNFSTTDLARNFDALTKSRFDKEIPIPDQPTYGESWNIHSRRVRELEHQTRSLETIVLVRDAEIDSANQELEHVKNVLNASKKTCKRALDNYEALQSDFNHTKRLHETYATKVMTIVDEAKRLRVELDDAHTKLAVTNKTTDVKLNFSAVINLSTRSIEAYDIAPVLVNSITKPDSLEFITKVNEPRIFDEEVFDNIDNHAVTTLLEIYPNLLDDKPLEEPVKSWEEVDVRVD